MLNLNSSIIISLVEIHLQVIEVYWHTTFFIIVNIILSNQDQKVFFVTSLLLSNIEIPEVPIILHQRCNYTYLLALELTGESLLYGENSTVSFPSQLGGQRQPGFLQIV